jgi:hypothetical protein
MSCLRALSAGSPARSRPSTIGFLAIEPQLYRYPAIDPASFSRRLEGLLKSREQESAADALGIEGS